MTGLRFFQALGVGVAPEYYGYLFGLNVVGLMLGALLNNRWVMYVGMRPLLRVGTQIAALAGMAVGYLHDGSPVPMAAVIATTGILSWSAQCLLGHASVIAAVPADAQTLRETARPEKQA